MLRDRGTIGLDWGQWTMRAFPSRLAVRAEAADEESLRRIQDLLTSPLTVAWQDPGGCARATARSEDIGAERAGHSPWSGVNAASRVAVIRSAASPASSRPAAVSSAAACMRL